MMMMVMVILTVMVMVTSVQILINMYPAKASEDIQNTNSNTIGFEEHLEVFFLRFLTVALDKGRIKHSNALIFFFKLALFDFLLYLVAYFIPLGQKSHLRDSFQQKS